LDKQKQKYNNITPKAPKVPKVTVENACEGMKAKNNMEMEKPKRNMFHRGGRWLEEVAMTSHTRINLLLKFQCKILKNIFLNLEVLLRFSFVF